MQILSYFPGQKATIFLETVDGYGTRTDSLTAPTIDRVVFPDLSLAIDFPQLMVKLDNGLYYFQFTLPTNGSSIGSYFVDISFTNPDNGRLNTQGQQIIVNAPFGNFGASVTL